MFNYLISHISIWSDIWFCSMLLLTLKYVLDCMIIERLGDILSQCDFIRKDIMVNMILRAKYKITT